MKWRVVLRVIIAVNYYVAGIFLVVAALMKWVDPAIGDILNTLVDRQVLSLDQMIIVYRAQPWLEITLGLFALVGWQIQWSARGMALLYLFFSGLIYYVVEGYLTMPIACGCFGDDAGSPAYLSFYRNVFIAVLLLFVTTKYQQWTIWHVGINRLQRKFPE